MQYLQHNFKYLIHCRSQVSVHLDLHFVFKTYITESRIQLWEIIFDYDNKFAILTCFVVHLTFFC